MWGNKCVQTSEVVISLWFCGYNGSSIFVISNSEWQSFSMNTKSVVGHGHSQPLPRNTNCESTALISQALRTHFLFPNFLMLKLESSRCLIWAAIHCLPRLGFVEIRWFLTDRTVRNHHVFSTIWENMFFLFLEEGSFLTTTTGSFSACHESYSPSLACFVHFPAPKMKTCWVKRFSLWFLPFTHHLVGSHKITASTWKVPKPCRSQYKKP